MKSTKSTTIDCLFAFCFHGLQNAHDKIPSESLGLPHDALSYSISLHCIPQHGEIGSDPLSCSREEAATAGSPLPCHSLRVGVRRIGVSSSFQLIAFTRT